MLAGASKMLVGAEKLGLEIVVVHHPSSLIRVLRGDYEFESKDQLPFLKVHYYYYYYYYYY